MTEPQTLAERILALQPADWLSEGPCRVGWNSALEWAAALADAAATTTPAEQAGDVGQAVRVKPLVWHNYDAWTWWAESTSGTYRVEERNGTWRATLNLPMTEHIIYEYETDGAPNDFEAAHLACQADHTARITAALEPDPTPALSWRAMQTAAERAAAKITLIGSDAQQQHSSLETSLAIRHAILALPGPTAEQATAEAVRLLSRDALMVENIDAVADACREFKIKPELFRAALAKIETVRGQGYRLSEALSAHVHPSTRNKAAGTPWSPKEDKILREMKTSWSELWTIAEELERSEQAIIERLRILEC